MQLRSIKQAKNLKNKIVLVRVDFNVALTSKGRVEPNELFRLERTLPTIKYLIKKRARIVLITHVGRPEGENNQSLSTRPLAITLKKLLGKPVNMIGSALEEKTFKKIQNIKPGQVVMLENIRFYKQEKDNDSDFAQQLAALGDIYVNDAFATSHRDAASMTSITKYLPSYAGLLLLEEVEQADNLLKKIKHPFVIVMGGAKVETKLQLIQKLLPHADAILTGGILANTLLKSAKVSIGKSLYDKDMLELGKRIVKKKKIHLPSDVVCDVGTTKRVEAELKDISHVRAQDKIIDIGTVTALSYAETLRTAKTIFFNGPLGWVEQPEGMHGSQALAEFIAALCVQKKVKTVIGGGQVVGLFNQLGLLKDITYASTGGGSLLTYLSGKPLPALKPLVQ